LAAKESGERKLPHVLVLPEFLACSLKVQSPLRYDTNFLDARKLDIQKRTFAMCGKRYARLLFQPIKFPKNPRE
jgi:hypothetical protein